MSNVRFEEELFVDAVWQVAQHDPSSLPVALQLLCTIHVCWSTVTLFRTENVKRSRRGLRLGLGLRCGHCTGALSVNQNWQQVETAADWISCSLPGLRLALPWCAAGHGRSVFAAACLAVSRYLATAGLFDGTQLHGTPARRDIPLKLSNLTFVAVQKLKRNTSRRPPSALPEAWSPWAEGGVVRKEGDEIRLVAVLAANLPTASIKLDHNLRLLSLRG